jgi:orotidine-5'-phosphate decarboxylase
VGEKGNMTAEIIRSTIERPSDRIIVALDNMNWQQAEEVMKEVGPFVGLAKVNALAQRQGWDYAIGTIRSLGAFTMADAKYKDVPSTMENHVREAMAYGPQVYNYTCR